QQRTGSRLSAVYPHRSILAQTNHSHLLHSTDHRAESQAGELDVIEVTELDGRASGVEVIDAVQRGVAAVAGQIEEHGRHAVVVAVVIQAHLGVEVDVPADAQTPLPRIPGILVAGTGYHSSVRQAADDAGGETHEPRP